MKEGQDFLAKRSQKKKKTGETAHFLNLIVPIVFMLFTRAS